MIEHRHILPILFSVAIVALIALFAAMRLVIEMARAAGRARRGADDWVQATVSTVDGAM